MYKFWAAASPSSPSIAHPFIAAQIVEAFQPPPSRDAKRGAWPGPVVEGANVDSRPGGQNESQGRPLGIKQGPDGSGEHHFNLQNLGDMMEDGIEDVQLCAPSPKP